MAASIAVIVIDCNNSVTVAALWKAALGYAEAARDGDSVKLRDPNGVRRALAINPVPEGTILNNRMQLGLRPSGTIDAEGAGMSPTAMMSRRRIIERPRLPTIVSMW